MDEIAILGTGMAGYGAAHHVSSAGFNPVLYDKNPHFGGHTSSYKNDQGFIFDFGPHISFTKDTRIQELFASFIDDEYEALQVKLNNYWNGIVLTHPVQLHMHGLPHDLIVKIISDFVEEQKSEERKINNYEDWLIASYGRTFAENFPMKYTRKYHMTSADNMTTDWLGPRMYRPSLEEMLRGSLSKWIPDVEHYVSHFRYPKAGGFFTYLNKLPGMGDLKLRHEVTSIDAQKKNIEFRDGTMSGFGKLVSSIPLPDIVPMIKGAPRDIVEASQRLACSTCVLVNVGVNRPDLSEAHMTYFYDEDIRFTRLSFPHMLCTNNVPEGCGSIQAEVYFSSKYRPLEQSPDELIEPVISDLIRSGILREDDEILSREAKLVKFANVIFDLDRQPALDDVHGYLDDIGIAYCGRYGDWDYMWTDESFISGERAAEKALSA
jgi:protoporphyrinogen oxidase